METSLYDQSIRKSSNVLPTEGLAEANAQSGAALDVETDSSEQTQTSTSRNQDNRRSGCEADITSDIQRERSTDDPRCAE